MDLELDFEKRHRLAREIIETIVLTVLMFLIIRLAVQNFNVDGMSMEPNLHNTELILVDKWSYIFRTPARGDIIVFVAPPQPNEDFVKRIIGLPGDVVTVQGTTVIVNGKTLDNAFVDPRREGNPFPPFSNLVVPPNTYFVLGDNREGSSDSRAWGCVPRTNLIGRAALVYWPLGQDNNGLIPNESIHFAGIPQPPVIQNPTFCHISKGDHNDFAHTPVRPGTDLLSANMALVLLLPGAFVFCSRFRRQVS